MALCCAETFTPRDVAKRARSRFAHYTILVWDFYYN